MSSLPLAVLLCIIPAVRGLGGLVAAGPVHGPPVRTAGIGRAAALAFIQGADWP